MTLKKAGVRRLPQFPPKDPLEEVVSSSVRLKQKLWDALDRVASAEGKSRNEVIVFFLEWACQDYEEGKSAKHHHKK